MHDIIKESITQIAANIDIISPFLKNILPTEYISIRIFQLDWTLCFDGKLLKKSLYNSEMCTFLTIHLLFWYVEPTNFNLTRFLSLYGRDKFSCVLPSVLNIPLTRENAKELLALGWTNSNGHQHFSSFPIFMLRTPYGMIMYWCV